MGSYNGTCCIESNYAPGSEYPWRMTNQKVKTYLHRKTWEEQYGPIPDGLWVLHRCDNRRCIRIQHLFLGTHADNMADMIAKGRGKNQQAQKPACKYGHEFSEENTKYMQRKRGGIERVCKTCSREHGRENMRAWRKKKREAA